MALPRGALNIAQASALPARALASARARASTQLALRQYHNHIGVQHRLQLPGRLRGHQQSSTSLLSPLTSKSSATARAYSTEAEGKPSKIWDFEGRSMSIQLQKLIALPDSSITIIDVREPAELQQTGRIPGAINVPITSAPDSFHISDEEFEDRFGYPRPGRDTEVVFYCKAGVRSRGAAGLAKEAGWAKVGEFPGSWVEWYEKGGKVER
ncbi:Thiosulfate sulfurtransferase RDL2, mitochondrial [Madurella mycetomatis]|uniref:Sulfurtransferase n=1 Tax=Madurella mycetomatis TaxID=100816 RepID=A0A175WF93_9PEZI|nr:Thiosulfate sulfurtransferase RDL2, mitochondrial [Madurella mycetomatis]